MRQRYQVLAVDDDPGNVDLLDGYLVSRGYDVMHALSGEGALKIIHDQKVDLVILDVRMPGLDGYEVLRQIRQNETTRLMPVVLVTALDSKEDKIKGIESGCDDFITKPFDMREVLARVKMLLEYNYYRSQLHEKERFDSIVRRMEDGVVVLNGDLGICRINNVAARLLSISPRHPTEDFLSHLQERFTFQYEGDFAADIRQKLILCDIERVRVENEPELFLNLKTTIIRDADGKVTDIIVIMRDITQRKIAEDKLKRAYEYLERTQFQLVQAAKMSCIGTLISGVAHEINNPLAAILSAVELLKAMLARSDISHAELVETADQTEAMVKRCVNITRSLLDMSHASKGSFEPVSLNNIIEKVRMLVDHDLKMNNITIEWSPQPGLPMVKGDTQLLQQVALDIIVNAKWAIQKKSGKAGGPIVIKTGIDHDKKSVDLFISDSGIGIPRENLDKIFEPFFTTKDVGEGTGLGLSIVNDIIKEHDGAISIESEVGKGTTFKITLPSTGGF